MDPLHIKIDSPVETKIVNGKTWERHYKRITPDDSTEGNIKWNFTLSRS